MTAREVIEKLQLEPLAGEGGYFRRTYAGAEESGKIRSSAIYYLETPESFSHLHRLPTDEIYHFYSGDPVKLLLLSPDGEKQTVILGQDIANGMQVQFVVPAGWWQGSGLLPGGAWALMGTTMAPGYTDADYTPADESLLTRFPAHQEELRQFLIHNS